MSYTPLPPVPEEFRVLSMMHNIGAVTPEKSLTLEELAMWTGFNASVVRGYLEKLRESGYVEHIQIQGMEKYHLTEVGIRKVLTLYS